MFFGQAIPVTVDIYIKIPTMYELTEFQNYTDEIVSQEDLSR